MPIWLHFLQIMKLLILGTKLRTSVPNCFMYGLNNYVVYITQNIVTESRFTTLSDLSFINLSKDI